MSHSVTSKGKLLSPRLSVQTSVLHSKYSLKATLVMPEQSLSTPVLQLRDLEEKKIFLTIKK